jgi:hypothetical protein
MKWKLSATPGKEGIMRIFVGEAVSSFESLRALSTLYLHMLLYEGPVSTLFSPHSRIGDVHHRLREVWQEGGDVANLLEPRRHGTTTSGQILCVQSIFSEPLSLSRHLS